MYCVTLSLIDQHIFLSSLFSYTSLKIARSGGDKERKGQTEERKER
jgi:hypothetical protein